ncbi:MAG TPA: T9SS type A sorting domain-containing protein, partial [Bacteroidetes bacterium]|nr:T9SS type A sorting domain-containing protein [Bacteroidota bacterium]
SPVYAAPITVSQTTVLKARVFSPNTLPGLHAFKTYFINESHTLPVVSIAGDGLQTLLGGDKTQRPYCSLEYFDKDGKFTSLAYGEMNSHGQDSWVNDQRSIDWVTRDEMGYANAVRGKLMPLSDRDKFQRVVLRAEGDDNYPGIDSSAHMRDMYVQTICTLADMSLDVRKAAKCVVYVDGIYWGVYSLREKVDDPDFTKEYWGQGKYDLEMLLTWGTTWIEYGGPNVYNDWLTVANFILTQNMSIQSNYDQVKAQYDVTSLTDYVLINSYVVCTDWLNYNTGWWRGLDPDGGHKRWGYIMWDDDATFGHYINYTGVASTLPNADPCQHELLTNNFADPEKHIRLLNQLRHNDEFDQYYVSRYIDLMNTYFSCDSMVSVLDSIVNVVDSEMPRHCTRWGGTYTKWQSNVQKLRDFVIARCGFIPQGLNSCYSLTGPMDLAFNVVPANAGWIGVNSLTLKSLPWRGTYYQGVPILLEAVEYDTTYIFDHWELANHTLSPNDSSLNVTLNLSTADSVIAHFRVRHPVAIDDPSYETFSLDVYPNPFTSETTVRVDARAQPKKLIVFDLLGKPVSQVAPSAGNEFKVSRDGMANGIYFFRVYDKKDRQIGTGKLVVE